MAFLESSRTRLVVEIFGVIAIAGSLIFVGIQLKQDRLIAGAAQHQARAEMSIAQLGNGVLDMAGNAFEWTNGWYEAYEGNTIITTEYGQVYRVLRGGSYRSSPYDVRTSRRHFDKMTESRDDYGFQGTWTRRGPVGERVRPRASDLLSF